MTSLGTKAFILRYVPFLIIFGGRLSLTTLGGMSRHATSARSAKRPRFESPQLSRHQRHSSVRHMSTQCSCHMHQATDTSFKPVVRSLHGLSGVPFVQKQDAP